MSVETTTNDIPKLTFAMFKPDLAGGRLMTHQLKCFFGPENYDSFRKAGKKGQEVPELDKLRVDREVYDKVGSMFGVAQDRVVEFWQRCLTLSNSTVDYARGILFADQDRKATLVTDIERDWDEGRPSDALERLTKSSSAIGEQLRFEQARQLGLGLLCAEIIVDDENGQSQAVRNRIKRDFYKRGFIRGREGDPKTYRVFSYHETGTNRLLAISDLRPSLNGFPNALWVKSLDCPARQIAVRNQAGEIEQVVPAIYDPREKKIESMVIKALQKSLLAAKSSGGVIATAPYVEDRLGLRFVLIHGGRPLRDRVAAEVERFFQGLKGFQGIKPDDDVNVDNGRPDRVHWRRWQVSIEGLKKPLEVIIQALPDFISYLYEVGNFNPEKGRHDGNAWDFHKLQMVDEVASLLWPFNIHGIDLEEARTLASYEYAGRLGRRGRIIPSAYNRYLGYA